MHTLPMAISALFTTKSTLFELNIIVQQAAAQLWMVLKSLIYCKLETTIINTQTIAAQSSNQSQTDSMGLCKVRYL